jgi:hypothetical protein
LPRFPLSVVFLLLFRIWCSWFRTSW